MGATGILLIGYDFFVGLALVSQDHVQRHLQAYLGQCRLFDDFPSLDFQTVWGYVVSPNLVIPVPLMELTMLRIMLGYGHPCLLLKLL